MYFLYQFYTGVEYQERNRRDISCSKNFRSRKCKILQENWGIKATFSSLSHRYISSLHDTTQCYNCGACY